MKKFAGSHPEEQYAPATRQKMFLDRPTSHGGWPEGEYDPPVNDRIYRWYKKMKMMPEGDDPGMRDIASSEQRRDLQKGRHGSRLGYLSDPESQELARELAMQIMASPDPSAELVNVMKNPHLAMNVWSELQSEGEYGLAKMVKSIADEYVTQRGKHMRITESILRKVIREELSRMNEVTEEKKKEAFAAVADAVKRSDKNPATQETELSKLADKLIEIGVTDDTTISDAFNATIGKSPKPGEGQALGSQRDSMAADVIDLISQKKSMKEGQRGRDENGQHDNDTDPGDPYAKKLKEGQRGNDENGQHDNDTDPGDPMAKKLKEARRLAIRKAVMAELNRRR